MAQTPMGENATLFIYREDEGNSDSAGLANGVDPERDLAWQAPDASKEDFEWLIKSAAQFHNIPCEVVEQ